MTKIFLDADHVPMGRISSLAAKSALQGNEVFVLNSEKAIITGRPVKTVDDFKFVRALNTIKPEKGPFISKSPEKILKRCIRSMLPDYRNGRGRVAWKLIRCYVGIPEEFSKEKLTKIKTKLSERFITVAELKQKA